MSTVIDNLKVQFYTSFDRVIRSGVVMDRFRSVKRVLQFLPSGKGGTVTIEKFAIPVDFYLILGDDGMTYRIECGEVKILTT